MTDVDLGQFPAPYPHESLRELGPDVFFLAGCMRMAPLMRISRNMTVVRQDGELVVFNAVRMSPAAEAELNQLGRVTHVVRLGSFHGLDDAYYVARYGAQFWCQRESTHYPEPAVNHELSEGGALPLPDAELFVFRETKRPECALLLKHGAGLLITCDSVQHYGDFGRHSLPAKLVMRTAGFHKGMLIGHFWLKYLTKSGGSIRPDFERLLQLPFDALISAHGTPILTGAKAALRTAMDTARWPDTLEKSKGA